MFYVYQDGKNDCGFTCLKILLANLNDDPNYLYLPNPKEDDIPYSFKDLIDYAEGLGFSLNAYKSDEKELLNPKSVFPFLASLVNGESSHLVMVYKMNKKFIYYIDPNIGKKKIKKDDFFNLWDGKMLMIDYLQKKKCPYKKENLLSKKEEILLILMQFIGCVSIFFGFYFIDEKFPFYLPIIFFSGFAIMEILLRSYALLLYSNIDKRIYNQELKVKEGRMKEFFLTLEKSKSYEVTFSMNMIYYTMSILLVCFIFIINGGFSMYYLLFGIFFALIEAEILQPYLDKKEKELSNLETDIGDDLSLIKLIHEKGYKYGRILLMYRYIVLGLSLLGIVLIMALSSVVSIPYVVFYLTINYFFYNNLTHFLNSDKKSRKNRQNRIHLINLKDNK